MRTAHVAIVVLVLLTVVGAAPAAEPPPVTIKDAPPNTLVKLEDSATGGRSSAAFFWAPSLNRFVLAAGLLSAKPHYDVETFDPQTGKWQNAYPQGAPYKAESGPTDAPVFAATREGKVSLEDAAGVSRIPLEPGYYANRGVYMHHQYALDPEAGRLYALFLNRLVTWDLKPGTWKFAGSDEKSATLNLKCTTAWGVSGFAGPGCFVEEQVLHWASFCWDPVNKEVLSIGGSSMDKGGTPGSWVYQTDLNKWEKLKLGTPEQAGLQDRLEKLRRSSWALLSHCRSRFFITESPEEAKVRLSERAGKLRDDVTAFGRELAGAGLAPAMKAGREHAAGRIGQYVEALGRLAGRLDGNLDAALLLEFLTAHRLLEAAELDLCPEPPGRAHAGIAWDPLSKKIVLFGGDGLDRAYGDTWIYDPASRSWEQKYPETSPAPRAGAVMDWLPEGKKIVLAGGYARGRPLPFEVWIYDAAANQWRNLQLGAAPGAGGGPRNYVGAIGTGDIMVMAETVRDGGVGRVTWGMKIDTSKVAAAPGGSVGVGAPCMTYVTNLAPDSYEKVARIEPEKMAAFFKNLPANKWARLPAAPVRPPKRDYGTCRYDPVRKQLLWWGGGHVNYWGTEVSHYSLRSGCWTASEQPDEPLEPCNGMSIKVGMSFQGRPQIDTHAYQFYDYDPPSGLLVCSKVGWTYLYDPAARLWESPPIKGGVAAVRAASGGAFGASGEGGGLKRFDAKGRKWVGLPATGDKIPGIDRDYQGFSYDSKRDCVWYFNRDGVWQYDVKTGACKRKTNKVTEKQVAGYFEEIIYVPELDKFMIGNRNGNDRQAFWDPEACLWLLADIPAVESDGSPAKTQPQFGATYGLAYDPESKLLLANDPMSVWALKLDPAALKFEENK